MEPVKSRTVPVRINISIVRITIRIRIRVWIGGSESEPDYNSCISFRCADKGKSRCRNRNQQNLLPIHLFATSQCSIDSTQYWTKGFQELFGTAACRIRQVTRDANISAK